MWGEGLRIMKQDILTQEKYYDNLFPLPPTYRKSFRTKVREMWISDKDFFPPPTFPYLRQYFFSI